MSVTLAFAMDIAGALLATYASDDFFRAILEYNRTQVNKGCASSGNNVGLGLNSAF